MSPITIDGVKFWEVDGPTPGKCWGCAAASSLKLCDILRSADKEHCLHAKIFVEGDAGMVRWTEERLTCPSTST